MFLGQNNFSSSLDRTVMTDLLSRAFLWKFKIFLFWATSRSKNLEKNDFFAIFRKSPRFRVLFESRDFYPRDSGFLKSRVFNPRDSGCFLISSFLSRDFFRENFQSADFHSKFALLSSFLFSYDLNKILQNL